MSGTSTRQKPNGFRLAALDIIDRSFRDDFAGHASKDMLARATWEQLPDDVREAAGYKGHLTWVSEYFRTKDKTGLPQAPAVNEEGDHALRGLLSVKEYEYVAARYLDRSDANRELAVAVVAECRAVHGVEIDLGALQESAS